MAIERPSGLCTVPRPTGMAFATALKFGDRTQIGAVHLATSLVAVLQLAAAALVWFFAPAPLPEGAIVSIVSLSAGAVLANVVSIVILIVETTVMRR